MKPFGPVTLRPASDGKWWAMNHREKGWSSFGYPFPFLGDALDHFGLKLTGYGTDRDGLYLVGTP